ncbi:MAG: hypothetical protein EBV51_08280 [Acidimicrobiia bacterium]|nr:hypothetical protein [Acidimicrobiia bacterium]
MIYSALADRIRNNKPVVLLTVIDGPNTGATLLVAPDQDKIKTLGSLGDGELDRVASRDALGELEAGRTSVRNYGPAGQVTPEDLHDTPIVRVFVESFSPPPIMIIFGAVDFTAALARVAKILGYYVVVCDAREVFATKRRFPMADEVLVTWPTPVLAERGPELGARDAICILTHDPKFDVPAVQGALATSVGYIGVMDLELAWLQSDLVRQKALFAALTQLGVPYKTNADEPGIALDCSALIKFAWSNAGVKMPRGSAQQYAFGERIKSSEVQLGDLAWYPGHISMSLGLENLVIQAPTNGRSVEVHKIDESRVNWVRWVDPTA